MTNITVPTPPSLSSYRDHLREFLRGMLMKLDMNSHKKTPDTDNIPKIIKKLRDEIIEFEEQFEEDMFDENALLELMDTANFAFLAFIALRNKGVKTTRERLIDEFLEIDVISGKIYCKKTRAGSQYRVGEEIRGTKRAGYINIKLQSSRSKITGQSIPRSHLVWYKRHGKWPIGVLDHDNNIRDDDRIENLKDSTFSDNNFNTKRSKNRKLPRYVVIYKPTNREHLECYGKFVYQRAFEGTNIRIAYFDTPELASIEGEKQWRLKTENINRIDAIAQIQAPHLNATPEQIKEAIKL